MDIIVFSKGSVTNNGLESQDLLIYKFLSSNLEQFFGSVLLGMSYI